MGASFLFAALFFWGSSPAASHSTLAANALRLRTMVAQSQSPVVRPGQPLLLNPNAGVCFTMRTYKVKPTGEWQDSFNGMRGYATCRMGSDYRVRTAVSPASK